MQTISAQPPAPEDFVCQVYHTIVDSTFDHYYLIAGADTCRFVKYDYDEWQKYYLKEAVPFVTLNELSEKAYLSRFPYFWKQPKLEKAICITVQKADTLLFPERYGKPDKKTPVTERLVFSFSLPQFTDDGKYAVIDLNSICGANCGISLTCIFRHGETGWRLIGRHINYSSSPQ
ncbi:hypothetical protein ACQ86N_38500 [Puia sp. P3]|uniref:hypothetical protein n=1 Tax=Puia sp. P3 TaxID=3423952 RepID=UPI003D66F6B4